MSKQSTKTVVKHLKGLLNNSTQNDFTMPTEDNAIREAIVILSKLEKIRPALAKVLDYNWFDELNDFQENEESRPSHIFRELVTLGNFITGREAVPESYLEAEALAGDLAREHFGVK